MDAEPIDADADTQPAGLPPMVSPPPPPSDTTPAPGALRPLSVGPPPGQLALPPYPGHGAPPPRPPPAQPPEIEATFFGTEEQTPAVLMEAGPPPDAMPPKTGIRFAWVAVAGLAVGGGITALYLFTQQPGDGNGHVAVNAEVDAGAAVVEVEPDAGEPELVLVPVAVDAGAVVVTPVVKDAGAVAVAPVVKDAGAIAVVLVVKDAGAVAVAPGVPDAGPMVVSGDYEQLVADAKASIQKQKWRSAMDAFRKALKLNPVSAEA